MTFCAADEAGNVVGRCENWGAHLLPTPDLLSELGEDPSCAVSVSVDLSIWEQRAGKPGAALMALSQQVTRLARGTYRVGEVVVALPHEARGSATGDADSSLYRPLAYVFARLERGAGSTVSFVCDRQVAVRAPGCTAARSTASCG